MKTLTPIPFSLDVEEIITETRVERGSSDEADFRALIKLARKVGKPKAAYAVCYVTGRNGDEVRVGDVTFKSRMLARNLASVERVFPHVATCGSEMDENSPAGGDMLKEFWWDIIKARLLRAANTHLGDHVRRMFRLGKTATMRPGASDAVVWPIEQQRELFSLLGNVENEIGVRLTDSFLMVPNKTTSGILFATATDFRGCEVCRRENCPSRKAPFDEALWKEIRHD